MSKSVVFTVINDLVSDQRMNRICSSLSAAGYEVTLVGRILPKSALLAERPYRQLRIRCAFQRGKFFYLEYNLRLFFKLLFLKLDRISAVDLDTLVACSLAARLKRKPLVFDAHEYFEQVPEVINRPVTQKVWTWVAHRFIPRSTARYTVGQALAEEFEKKYGKPFGVIMNAPVLEPKISEMPKKDKIYLYQGALNRGRGIENYISLMQYTDGTLWIVGEGDLSRQLRAQAAESPAADRIVFHGFVKPEDLPEYTRKAKIGLNVSENVGMSYYLSLNNKFFDYIHAGLPSVINRFPEYERLNRQFQVGVMADYNPKSILAALKMFDDEAFYQQITENCVRAAQAFNWQIEEQKLLSIYNEIN